MGQVFAITRGWGGVLFYKERLLPYGSSRFDDPREGKLNFPTIDFRAVCKAVGKEQVLDVHAPIDEALAQQWSIGWTKEIERPSCHLLY